MKDEGPRLETLTRRLADCPPEFLLPPRAGGAGRVNVAAVVSDLLADLGGARLDRAGAAPFEAKGDDAAARNRLATQLVAAWLLHDPWFRNARRFAPAARSFLAEGLDARIALVAAAQWTGDPDRREELARAALEALSLRPAGETRAQAEDRLATLDSVRRSRVLAESKKAQERIRAIREAMAKKAAEEAAARYSRE